MRERFADTTFKERATRLLPRKALVTGVQWNLHVMRQVAGETVLEAGARRDINRRIMRRVRSCWLPDV